MRPLARNAAWLLAVVALLPRPLPADTPPDAADVADVEAGRYLYDRCTGCHSPERNRTGPLHCGVLGRHSGTVIGFAYSGAMRGADIVWTAEALDRFLEAPLEVVPGTTMGFAGVSDAEERRQLIAWLGALSASSEYCEGTGMIK